MTLSSDIVCVKEYCPLLGSSNPSEEELAAWARHDGESFPYPWTLASWLTLFLASKQAFYLVELRERNGTLVCLVLYLLTPDDGFAHLVKVFTTKTFKRKHWASYLLDSTHEKLSHLGIGHFYLEVEQTNRGAIGLYEGLGYQRIHHKKHFYGQGLGADIMERRV